MALARRINPKAARPAKKVSRYAGISAAQPREPFPMPGEYLFKVIGMVEGHNPGKGTDSVKVKLEVIESEGEEANKVGATVAMVEVVTGGGAAQALSRVKAFVMACAGFEGEDEYDAFDPDGEFIEACLGASNEYAADERLAVGRLVAAQVTRGRSRDDGDFYRNYAWGVVEQ